MQGSRCEILVSLEGVWYCQVSLEDGNVYAYSVRTMYDAQYTTYTVRRTHYPRHVHCTS